MKLLCLRKHSTTSSTSRSSRPTSSPRTNLCRLLALCASPFLSSTMTRLTAAATSSLPNQPSSSSRRATSTPTPRSAIIRAMSPWSSSSPAASSRTFSAVTGASLPSATYRTLRGGCLSSHRTAPERVASVVGLSSGRRKPVGTTAGLRKTSAMSGNSRGSSSGQLRTSRRRQRCSVCQKRSMSETPEALGRNEAAIHAASWRRKVREGGEGNHLGMGMKSSTVTRGWLMFSSREPQ
nr:unnamed protein product [Digitaria exilis]